MNIGSHVSIAGGLDKAPANSKAVGGSVFQIFSRSPRGGSAPAITPELLSNFKLELKLNQQKNFYIHAPYYINLASTNNRIYQGSISVLRDELKRASILGAVGVMTHLGSANDLSRKEALEKTAKGLKEILKDYQGSSLFLLENSAGSGTVIGNKFEELSFLINSLPKPAQKHVGVCLDTCHAFASGYDLRDKKSVAETLKQFDKTIGLKKLVVIHLNDSKTELGKAVDRHEHLGLGEIGLKGFKELVNQPKINKIDLILETPIDDHGDHSNDLKILKKIIK